MPAISGRVTVPFDVSEPPPGVSWASIGSPGTIAADMRAFAEAGVRTSGSSYARRTRPANVAIAEHFVREVIPLVGYGAGGQQEGRRDYERTRHYSCLPRGAGRVTTRPRLSVDPGWAPSRSPPPPARHARPRAASSRSSLSSIVLIVS
jgi:hypothetical protein